MATNILRLFASPSQVSSRSRTTCQCKWQRLTRHQDTIVKRKGAPHASNGTATPPCPAREVGAN
eukprot:3894075-Amphidinium_carterae.1